MISSVNWNCCMFSFYFWHWRLEYLTAKGKAVLVPGNLYWRKTFASNHNFNEFWFLSKMSEVNKRANGQMLTSIFLQFLQCWCIVDKNTQKLKTIYFTRCNVVGQDLNRAWAETNKFLHSEILEVSITDMIEVSHSYVLNKSFQIKKQLVYYDNHSEWHKNQPNY